MNRKTLNAFFIVSVGLMEADDTFAGRRRPHNFAVRNGKVKLGLTIGLGVCHRALHVKPRYSGAQNLRKFACRRAAIAQSSFPFKKISRENEAFNPWHAPCV